MKIQLILLSFLIVQTLAPIPKSYSGVVSTRPKIKNLDLSFSCDTAQVKTLDECYYSGIQELNTMGCHLKGAVSASNCDISSEQVNLDSGDTHVKKEWVCSVPSTNCKETLNEPCPLDYREVNRFSQALTGNGAKVFLNFLNYCVWDPQNGRKDRTQIRQNAPQREH